MQVYKKSGSAALTGITKKAYDGTSMLAGMETAAATAANLDLPNMVEYVQKKFEIYF